MNKGSLKLKYPLRNTLSPRKGETRLRKKNKGLLKYNPGSDNGFDDIAIKPFPDFDNPAFDPNTFNLNELIVIEAKPKNPGISLGTANRIPPPGTVIQMDKDWVEQTAQKLKDTRDPLKIKLGDLIIKAKNDGKLSKALVAVDKQTGEIIVQKLN